MRLESVNDSHPGSHLVGHSTGGAIGQSVASRFPGRLERLVLSVTWTHCDPYFRRLFTLRRDIMVSEQCDLYDRLATLLLYPPDWIVAHDDELVGTSRALTKLDRDIVIGKIDALLAFDRREFLPGYLPIDPKKPIRADQLHQPYVEQGVSYLLVGYKIIYQLLAAKRNAIVLMPISAFGSWGPLAAQSGQWRLIKEVVRFLYARRLASSRAAPFARFSLNGGRTSIFARDGLFTDELVPDKASITISAFSAGINAVVSLCATEQFDDKSYSSVLFSAPAAPFLSEWREIWDIDGVDASGWDHLVKTLKGWVSSTSQRSLRSYHSEDTYQGGPDNGLVESSKITRKAGKAGFVEEGTSNDGHIT